MPATTPLPAVTSQSSRKLYCRFVLEVWELSASKAPDKQFAWTWNWSLAEFVRSSRSSCTEGTFVWKNAVGDVLYVGKAKSLRKRMRQYLALHDDRPMVPKMMARVDGFDYVVTGTEMESLILEANLIKEIRPPYNVD